ncbi:conserved hypothetical protein [Picrophilus oshimae DSM 9789]|uniref:Probable tRNA pseudouridine synthase D n=2 Tax=Picrophilus oshimae TaxID=46632 RepID=TRUD_PICTO|nr:RecName: Full=Probable tRNA pseudouridine synthase D; AltName: Full=tRNA pseudouridine(13) synthase; AltName: Full=tRNA pseudouridylate synthase D; AltName: Full=tRNA-uridine isomerase D [Picrophilus oshimae DSM 9789]AAT43090.1 conserved hypothetical protein [Picrophilus oshimae DSM 9789]
MFYINIAYIFMDLGMYGYITKTEKLNGMIKSNPEDFIVEEIPFDIKKDDNGKYLIIKARLYDWDTNRFVMYLARHMNISRKRITYAGTKDKRAVTTQYFCINTDRMFSGSINGIEIIEQFRSNDIIKLGDLYGNRFLIKVDYPGDLEKDSSETLKEINEKGGFPNFFGVQRFGSMRSNTHYIGKMIIKGEYEKAADKYLYDDNFDTEEYRINYGKNMDAKNSLKEYPGNLTFERSILGAIASGNKSSAFNALPKNLSIMFVHAFQSYLFNKMLSERMKHVKDLKTVIEGDLLYNIDDYFNPDKKRLIEANRYNLEMLNNLSSMDKIRPVIPLPGFDTRMPDGLQRDIMLKVLEDENVSLQDFKIPGEYSYMSSSGDYRIISAKPINLKFPEKNKLDFILGRGIYATSFLREIIK